MLRTMKRLIALSFGIAFPVETHLWLKKEEMVSKCWILNLDLTLDFGHVDQVSAKSMNESSKA